MIDLFVCPLDVWLFRDGRPFDSGGNHRAESMFPPYPSTTQGAIRSYQLSRLENLDLNDKSAVEKAVGTSTDMKDLRLRGPIVAQYQDGSLRRYYPQPADAISVDETHVRPTNPPVKPPEHIRVSTRTELIGFNEPLVKGKSGLWLLEENLTACLRGETVEALPADMLFERENRPAIGMDNPKRASLQGALYEVEFIRPQPGIGLWLQMDGQSYADWPNTGILSLGGERRAASFEKIASPRPLPQHPRSLPPRFKIYFASPAYFSGGWQPAQSWERFFTGKVNLHAAAIARYECLGGYDMSNPHSPHKPSRRYVPAGSVYYFSGQNIALRDDLPQHAVTEEGGEIGFGQIFIEEW